MKKIQTIVDREPLSSDYIESKQDFSTVLSQVKQLPTASWKSPWFYGPIGIAVFSVTISIVSLNPSSAKVVEVQPKEKEIAKTIEQVETESATNEVQVVKENIKEEVTSEIKKELPVLDQKALIETSVKAENNSEKSIALPVEKSKEKVVVVRSVPENNKYPHIEGFFTDEIPADKLFSEYGIQLNSTVKITSFDFNYYNGKSNVVIPINGNKIPLSYQSDINNYNINRMIFITNIKAVDNYNRVFTLPSINFTPIKIN